MCVCASVSETHFLDTCPVCVYDVYYTAYLCGVCMGKTYVQRVSEKVLFSTEKKFCEKSFSDFVANNKKFFGCVL